MNCRDASLFVLGTVLTLNGNSASAAPAAHVPQIDAARTFARLIARTDRALRRYLDACRSDRDALDVVTSDARLEYTLDNPGALLSLDASSIFASCSSTGFAGVSPGNLWIYPTGDDSTVFVQYDLPTTGGPTSMRQVAMIEMRGERIHRMRNFGQPPEIVLAAVQGRAQTELCARLSWQDVRLAMTSPVGAWQPLGEPDSASVSSP